MKTRCKIIHTNIRKEEEGETKRTRKVEGEGKKEDAKEKDDDQERRIIGGNVGYKT